MQEYSDRLVNLLPKNTPVYIAQHLEGATYIRDTDAGKLRDLPRFSLSVGAKAGNVSFANVLHEVGHFIDIDDRRILQPSWGSM